MKNIEAVQKLSKITGSSMGPNGMNKMVINHLEKLMITSDAAAIMHEMDVIHPAAKIVTQAAHMQEQEIGDGTNFVITFAGELLTQAEGLLRMGLHTSEIIQGYTIASQEALKRLETLVVKTVDDVRDTAQIVPALKTALASKVYGYEEMMAEKVANACQMVLPDDSSKFNVDNVRVSKLLGKGVTDSVVINGLVQTRQTDGTIKHMKDCKCAIFSGAIEAAVTETKGTVLIKTAEELENYNNSEEAAMEATIKEISDAGCNVIISGSTISELALHFIERYKMMACKTFSKFELRRICKTVNGTALVKVGAPTKEETGTADEISVEEYGGQKVTVYRASDKESAVSTILLRGSTTNILDDVERAIDDGVHVFKEVCKDGRFVPGAGAAEIELARQMSNLADEHEGLEQYSIRKFGEAFEVVPRTLAENAGAKATDLVASLYVAHNKGNTGVGVDIDNQSTVDALQESILDAYTTKYWAIKLAVDAVLTILRVDQIIMSKQAGGPKPPKPVHGD